MIFQELSFNNVKMMKVITLTAAILMYGTTTLCEDTVCHFMIVIQGYYKPNAYIASQAPMPDTTKDFWQMVWDNKAPAIVMLTKLVEAGKPKCHKYWPDKVGENLQPKDHLSVRLTALQYFADYEIRTMEVTNVS